MKNKNGKVTNDLIAKANELQQKRVQTEKTTKVETQKSDINLRSILGGKQPTKEEIKEDKVEVEKKPTPAEETLQKRKEQEEKDATIEALSKKVHQAKPKKTKEKEHKDRPLTKSEKIALRNKQLLDEAKNKKIKPDASAGTKRKVKLAILLTSIILLVVAIGLGIWWVYVTWINPASDGTTRVSVSIDGREYPEWEIIDAPFSMEPLNPGDKLDNEIIALNAFSSQDEGAWETIYIRFRVDLYDSNDTLRNDLIHVKVDDNYWFHYDETVENNYINPETGEAYCLENDGWYYYSDQLKSKEKTKPLFEYIELIGNNIDASFASQSLDIVVTVQSISVANHEAIVSRFTNGTTENITIWGGNGDGVFDTEVPTYWSTCPQAWIEHIRQFSSNDSQS